MIFPCIGPIERVYDDVYYVNFVNIVKVLTECIPSLC